MNILYGLLTYGVDEGSGWYSKKHNPVRHTVKSGKLLELLTAAVPAGRRELFASVLCSIAVNSVFGAEIREFDGNNTYCTVTRDPSAPSGSAADVMSDMLPDEASTKPMYAYLDKDIRDRLVLPSWPELASAVCLQMLREAA